MSAAEQLRLDVGAERIAASPEIDLTRVALVHTWNICLQCRRV
jgi:hypothetical protein